MWECHIALRLALVWLTLTAWANCQGLQHLLARQPLLRAAFLILGLWLQEEISSLSAELPRGLLPFSLFSTASISSFFFPLPHKDSLRNYEKSGPQGRTWDKESEVPKLEPRFSPKPAMWSWANHIYIKTPLNNTVSYQNSENSHIQKKKEATTEEPWIWGTLLLLVRYQFQKQR